MFPENKEEGFLYEDDADFEEEFDVDRDLYLNTIDSMIRDSVDNREEVKFEDFAARAGLLMGAHRLKNNTCRRRWYMDGETLLNSGFNWLHFN